MPGLKEVRSRIASVKSTRKITSAMKMVAASRLRQVQNKILHLRLYEKKLMRVIADMIQMMPEETYHQFYNKTGGNEVLIICIGSNRGMCGIYNAMVIRHSLNEIERWEQAGYRVKLMTLGNKPFDFFKNKHHPVILADNESIDRLDAEKASAFAEKVMEVYMKHNLSGVVMVYHRFRNAAVQDLHAETLLPLSLKTMSQNDDQLQTEMDDYERLILEPDAEDVWHYMTSQFIRNNCFRVLLDAAASEHGSRLTAMHQATDNADKLMKSLTLSYNKARQTNITRELLDIMGGVEGRKL